MFCKKCGKEIDDNAMVCPNCGVATENMAAAQQPVAVQPQEAEKKVNVCAIIGFIFSLLTIAGTFIHAAVYWICFVAGLTLSIVGCVMAKKCNSGKGLAIAGIVISVLSIDCLLCTY
ncbi:MAG: zinc-ribbon domain-containing protein, partial [Clostridia bacterium]|nr:zinc-ribbon domain-containing protein [Clostridia bacterium]